jgi:hypothetical protein
MIAGAARAGQQIGAFPLSQAARRKRKAGIAWKQLLDRPSQSKPANFLGKRAKRHLPDQFFSTSIIGHALRDGAWGGGWKNFHAAPA